MVPILSFIQLLVVSQTFFQLIFLIFLTFQVGSEFQLRNLFRRFIFSPKYLDPTELALATLSQMNLSEDLRPEGSRDAASTPVDKSTLDRSPQNTFEFGAFFQVSSKTFTLMTAGCHAMRCHYNIFFSQS